MNILEFTQHGQDVLSANAVPASILRRLLSRRGSPAIGTLVPVAGHRAHLNQLAHLARQPMVDLFIVEEMVGDGHSVRGFTGGSALVLAKLVEPHKRRDQPEKHEEESSEDQNVSDHSRVTDAVDKALGDVVGEPDERQAKDGEKG